MVRAHRPTKRAVEETSPYKKRATVREVMAMYDLKTGIGNIGVGVGSLARASNRPKQFDDRKNPYFADATGRFIAEYAKYASNHTAARMQGLNANDFYEWSEQVLRLADVNKRGGAIDRPTDGYKAFLVEAHEIEYVPEGAKVETMGSTWLVTNPANVSGAVGSGIMRRCNATWNHLDWYGNLKKEPMVVEKAAMNATANDFQETVLLMQGYFNIIMQYNEETAELDVNSRLMLGRSVYQITGYAEISEEFTGDEESVHLLYFTARIKEPDKEKDDMVNRVANAYPFQWTVEVTGRPAMSGGAAALFTARSTRNGAAADGDEDHPVHYLWESSDETICAVDANGTVTAKGMGTCRITATVVENPELTGWMEVTVAEGFTGVRFTSQIPERLRPFETVEVGAVYVEDGVETDRALTWTLTGDADAFTAEVNGSKATIRCWSGSETPLRITAAYEGEVANGTMVLEGY